MVKKTVDIQKIKATICEDMESAQEEQTLSEAFPPITPPQPKIDKIEPPEVSLNLPQAFQDFQQEDLAVLDSHIAEHLHYLNTHYCTDTKKELPNPCDYWRWREHGRADLGICNVSSKV